MMAGIVTLPKGYEMQKPAGKSSSSGDLAQRLGSLTRQQLAFCRCCVRASSTSRSRHELDVGETTVKAHVSRHSSEAQRGLADASRDRGFQDRLRRRDGAGTAVGRPSPPRIAVSEERPGGEKVSPVTRSTDAGSAPVARPARPGLRNRSRGELWRAATPIGRGSVVRSHENRRYIRTFHAFPQHISPRRARFSPWSRW